MKITSSANLSTLLNDESADKSAISSPELNHIFNIAENIDHIDHQEISNLTKLILRLKPEQIDETVQARLANIMLKVKAQYA